MPVGTITANTICLWTHSGEANHTAWDDKDSDVWERAKEISPNDSEWVSCFETLLTMLVSAHGLRVIVLHNSLTYSLLFQGEKMTKRTRYCRLDVQKTNLGLKQFCVTSNYSDCEAIERTVLHQMHSDYQCITLKTLFWTTI